jgi:hypothetical protein
MCHQQALLIVLAKVEGTRNGCENSAWATGCNTISTNFLAVSNSASASPARS